MPNKTLVKNTNNTLKEGAHKSTLLVKPGETLVKKETNSVVVRTKEGKLVRRTDSSGKLSGTINLIKPGEVFIREETGAIIIRNEAGKLVKRKVISDKKTTLTTANGTLGKGGKEPSGNSKKEGEYASSGVKLGSINPALKVVRINSNEQSETKEEETAAATERISSLRDRLKSRHAFLDRLDKGESVSSPREVQESDKPLNLTPSSDLVEDIEDIEDVQPDASVTALEDAVTSDKYKRTIGKMSSAATRGSGRGKISSSALNPNQKPVLGAESKMSQSLAGNSNGEYELAKPEKDNVSKKIKKEKKQKKPFNATAFVISLVAIYVIGIAAYFFIGYNFKPKKVDVILYYITIGEDAKLKYYDGEKINTTDMLMTFYYSENDVKQSSLTESNIAEPTVGMGYNISNMGYVNALWTGDYTKSESRQIKLKFNYDGLICYVPVTVYRNKLNKLIKHFEVPSLEAGQEINPTIYAEYTNEVIEENGEVKQRELSHADYDLILTYEGESYSLKELGCFKNGKYMMPEEIDGQIVDYDATGLVLTARYYADGFNQEKNLVLFSN